MTKIHYFINDFTCLLEGVKQENTNISTHTILAVYFMGLHVFQFTSIHKHTYMQAMYKIYIEMIVNLQNYQT